MAAPVVPPTPPSTIEWVCARRNKLIKTLVYRTFTYQGYVYSNNAKIAGGMSRIENYSKGDAIQIMVSTNGKLINGKNEGLGWRTRQLGGYLSDNSLQQLAQNLFKADTQVGQPNPQQHAVEIGQQRHSMDQYQWTEITPVSTPCSRSPATS